MHLKQNSKLIEMYAGPKSHYQLGITLPLSNTPPHDL